MSSKGQILIVVDPTHKQHLALERLMNSSEEMYKHFETSILVCVDNSTADTNRDSFGNFLDMHKLQEILAPLNEKKIDHQVTFCWAGDWQKSVINYAESIDAKLVVIPDNSQNHKRTLFSDARWDLLRKSPCPVSIVREERQTPYQKILVAVNAHAKTEERKALNSRITAVSDIAKQIYNSEIHVVSAYPDSMNYPDRANLLDLTNAPQENIHVAEGAPEDVVPKIASEINADIVVIGTMRKNGLKEIMRGQLAERLLQKIDTDVMTVN